MNNPLDLLKRTLLERNEEDFDIVDVVPIPMHGDRMLRLRTLEEALADFESSGQSSTSSMGYFVQIKTRQKTATPSSPDQGPALAEPMVPATTLPGVEGVYLSDGKLNIPFLLQTAEVLYRSADFGLARNIYKAIISSGEKISVALLGLARCFESEGKLEEARISYEEAITYHPHTEAYKALTALLILQRKDQEAAEVIDRALHHRELEPQARYELHKTAGNCWVRVNVPREAERHYRKALEIQASAEIHCNLGALYLQEGKNSQAEKQFEDALATSPNSAQALMGLGTCSLAGGNKLAAHAWFARSLQVEIRNPTALFHLVKCAFEIKQFSVAAGLVERYIDVAPVSVPLLYSLAGLQFHLGHATKSHEKARQTCMKIQQIKPDHAGARDLLSRIEGMKSD